MSEDRPIDYQITDDTKLHRLPERGHYDRDTVHAILDEGIVAHVGLMANGRPVVIPMVYGREGDILYIHGSAASRLLRQGKAGNQLCVTVTLVDGLVLARSPFHHSVNFRSVVVMGAGTFVDDPLDKHRILDLITEHVVPGRIEGVRSHTEKELRATLVLALPINEASAKLRSGPPVDDDEDYVLDHWAGVIPLGVSVGDPIPDPRLTPGIELPDHVSEWSR
jgi:nitroimidazol reductase NimA-like FMN-containing flavoprotein (pyridoxamine 5'-phosphate oxidase superfamily)